MNFYHKFYLMVTSHLTYNFIFYTIIIKLLIFNKLKAECWRLYKYKCWMLNTLSSRLLSSYASLISFRRNFQVRHFRIISPDVDRNPSIPTASFMYHQIWHSKRLHSAPSTLLGLVWFSERSVIIMLQSIISVIETESVYCAVRISPLYIIQVNFRA